MRFYWLALGVLATWRITHLMVAEDGPWDMVVRLRRRAGSGFWGKLLDCFYCLSIWVAAPLAALLGQTWREGFLLWLAFSAGAILLERATNPNLDSRPAAYSEETEEHHELLRREENGDDGGSTGHSGPDTAPK